MPLAPPTGLPQASRRWPASPRTTRGAPPAPVTRYGASGGHPSSAANATFAFPPAGAYTGPREDGVMLGRIIGLVLVAVAVSATASAQDVKLPEIEFGRVIWLGRSV